MLTVDGETTFLAEWARRYGLHEDTLRRRVLVYGWSHDKAVKTPAGTIRAHGRPAGKVTVGEESLTISEWAAKTGIPESRIRARLAHGWTPAFAVSEPYHRGKREESGKEPVAAE